jgi:AhpD family alkylhydroperoxidase
MPRLRQVPRAEAPPEALQMYERLFGDRDPVAEPGTATGTPGNWWTVFALSPDILSSCVTQFGLLNSKKRKLDPVYRELAITRAAFVTGSQFSFSQHSKALRATGVGDEKVAAVPSWATSDLFDVNERAVLAYADEVALQNGRVQDATFDRLKTFLEDEAILELTFAAALYHFHSIMARALRLEYDDVDERVVEIPAPSEATGSANILGQISRD